MESPRFLLYGIGGVYNYGCEAIVRGTETMIREKWPDAVVKYASPRPEDDRRRLQGASLEIVSLRQYGRYSLRNILRKLTCMTGCLWTPLIKELYPFLHDCDVVLSIGGDLYTILPGNRYAQSLLHFGEIVMKSGPMFVIWGASIGPFDENQRMKTTYLRHLRKVPLITSREPDSTHYLNSLGFQQQVVACADPAFVVNGVVEPEGKSWANLTIGINLSPLSVIHMLNGANFRSAISQYSRAICRIADEFHAHIVLIPHVVCDFNEADDDFRFLESIMFSIPKELRGRIRLINSDPGFLGIKAEIARCDLVIAARMHCAINAMAACVPTLLVSYSQKSIGMARYVYGHTRWIVQLQDFCSSRSLRLIQEILSQKNATCHHLRERMPLIKADARNAVHVLYKRIAERA